MSSIKSQGLGILVKEKVSVELGNTIETINSILSQNQVTEVPTNESGL